MQFQSAIDRGVGLSWFTGLVVVVVVLQAVRGKSIDLSYKIGYMYYFHAECKETRRINDTMM